MLFFAVWAVIYVMKGKGSKGRRGSSSRRSRSKGRRGSSLRRSRARDEPRSYDDFSEASDAYSEPTTLDSLLDSYDGEEGLDFDDEWDEDDWNGDDAGEEEWEEDNYPQVPRSRSSGRVSGSGFRY